MNESADNGESEKVQWALAIHGGIGSGGGARDVAVRQSLADALSIGRDILEGGGTSLEAVEAVVNFLEDDPLFNAGRGGAITADGVVEMDAAIMDGSDLSTGAVAAVRRIKNPISLAKAVMSDGRHVLLAGPGAEEFGQRSGVVTESDDYFRTEERLRWWQSMQGSAAVGSETGDQAFGTVGAVALDREGNLAAATSTGGLMNKLGGRIGDSPIVGAGTYANNETCAISCTGKGEEFIRNFAAARVSMNMSIGEKGLVDSVEDVISNRLPEDSGGIIAVDRRGNMALLFNTGGMNRGAADSTGRFEVETKK